VRLGKEKKKSEKENKEVPENKEKRVEPWEKKEREPAERKGKANMSFYAKESGVKRAFLVDQPMIFLVYKESYLNLDETDQSFPSLAVSLLQEFEDVFPEKMPSGLCHAPVLECKGIRELEKNKIIHEFKSFYI
jgi:hypothetical protein